MSIALYPARLVAGLFFLNSGYGKRNLDEASAKGLRDMGAAGVPQLKEIEPKQFGQALHYGEMAIGATLVAPFVPNWLAGLALGAFSGGLVNMYRNTPGMTEDGIRPTQQGTALAKDAWLVGIAASLVLDSLLPGGKKKSKK